MFRALVLAAVLAGSPATARAPGDSSRSAPTQTVEFHCGKTFMTFSHFGQASGALIFKTVRKAAVLGLAVPAVPRGRLYIHVVEDPARPSIGLIVPRVLRKPIIKCLD